MSHSVSRRSLLKSMAAAPAIPLPQAAAQDASAAAPDLASLRSGDPIANFDKRDGSIYSLASAADALHTNFLGNASDTRGVRLRDAFWTGPRNLNRLGRRVYEL